MTGERDAGRDASRPDASADANPASDAGSDAASVDAHAGFDCTAAIFCEDFETHALGVAPGAPWTVSENMGHVVVDDAMAASGSRALSVTTDDGAGTYRRAYAVLAGAPVFPAAADAMYGRMRVYVVATPPGSVHWTNVQGEGDVPGMTFRALYRYGGQVDGHLMANYETSGAASDCWQHSGTVMPTGRWACLEWHFDRASDAMDLWLDGAPLADLSVRGVGEGCIGHDTGDHWYAPVFDRVSLGWEHYQAVSMRRMWIDDVAIDDTRIGCD